MDAPVANALSSALSALADAARELAAAARALRAPSSPALPSSSSSSPPLVELVNEFLLAKARAGRSERYLRQLRVSLRSLLRGRPDLPAAELTPAHLETWLASSGWASRTRLGYLFDARTLLSWARRRGYVQVNVADAVDLPRPAARPPGIHSPEETAAVLAHVARDPGVVRVMALRYFGGIRAAEVLRLDESDIREGFVQVEASKAKTRRRRLVTVGPTLAAWLSIEGGELPVSGKRVRRALAGCPVPWTPNAPRHSFVSYHLAAGGSAAKTALEAGHSEAVLFAAYRELVTPEAARRYWALRPGSTPESRRRPPA